MKIKMLCGFNNISWLRFNLAPLTNDQQLAELGRGWSRCLSWGEWDKLWRAGSSWAADRSYPAVISLRCEEYCLLLLYPHGSDCYWKTSTFKTLMAAPDTRYSARQFNFNQRMVLMILLYNFRLFNNTPIFKRCRGGDKNKFGLLLLRLGKGNSLTLNAVLPIICSSARVVVNDGGALIGCFPGGPPLRSRGWWRVMLLLVALGLPLLLARGQYRGRVRGLQLWHHYNQEHLLPHQSSSTQLTTSPWQRAGMHSLPAWSTTSRGTRSVEVIMSVIMQDVSRAV